MITKLAELLLGIVLYSLSPLISVKKKRWVLGSSQGKDFKEGAKYFLEYLNSFDSAIDAVWITSNKITKDLVKQKGFNCYMNKSLPGLYYSLTAEVVITCTSFGSDVNYCFKKNERKFVYLIHGMPQKKIIYDQPNRRQPKQTVRENLYRKYIAAFTVLDINYITSTSSFYTPFIKSAFRSEKVFEIGMPRNDALLNPKFLENEKWLDNLDNKFVITYMPTHRNYGNGEVSPFLFEGNESVNEYFKKNNIVLLIKNHPNMSCKVIDGKNMSNIIDISKKGYDAQMVIYNTDLLITDYSSVWIDYLLLRRPTVFYLYDNYETDDNETYFDIRTSNVGPICLSEEMLFETINNIFTNYKKYIPKTELINIHHKHIDAKSCQRLYNLLNA